MNISVFCYKDIHVFDYKVLSQTLLGSVCNFRYMLLITLPKSEKFWILKPFGLKGFG